MLSPEIETDTILAAELPRCAGAFVEVGCGNSNFSFLTAGPLGFKTYAVEPIWNESLSQCAKQFGTELFLGVISDIDGARDLYLHAKGDDNFASIMTDWNAGGKSRSVYSWTLGTFCVERDISKVSCLKLDVESAELIIIRQIIPELLPDIVVFEYGGGSDKRDRQGGWTNERYANTLQCLAILKRLGYKRFIRLDWKAGRHDFTSDFVESEIFPPDCHYGNIMAFLA